MANNKEDNYKKKLNVKPFNSFEEMNEWDAIENAAILPIIHLQNAVSVSKRIFSEELKKPMDKAVKFK